MGGREKNERMVRDTEGGLQCKKRAMERERSSETEKESRIPAYRWPRRDEVCTWCRLTCLFSWRTRPRCRKVSGQRAKSLEIRSLFLSLPLSPPSRPGPPSPPLSSAPSPLPPPPSPPLTPTFLIRLCLPLARWREEILEMRDSFIKGEKRCQRGRHHRVGRFDHTNYRDSSTRPARLYPCLSFPFLSFFLSSFLDVPGSLSRARMTSRERSAREKYVPSDRATHFVLNCVYTNLNVLHR